MARVKKLKYRIKAIGDKKEKRKTQLAPLPMMKAEIGMVDWR